MLGRRVLGFSLVATGVLVVGMVAGDPTSPTAAPSTPRPVALAAAAHEVVPRDDRRDDDDYWRAYRRGYQIGFRDGIRAARVSCWWERNGYDGRNLRERGFANGYARGFRVGFDRGIGWFCRHHD